MNGLILRLTALLLPAAVRTRYRQEFRADLVMLRRRARLPYSVRVLLGAPALRRAVTGAGGAKVTEHDHRPLRCRAGHHAWVKTHVESGEVHRQCSRCGEDEYDASRTRSDESNVLGGLVQGFGNAGTGG